MRTSNPTIAVIGGGVAGLAAAHELATGQHDFALFEASNWLGGQIRSEQSGDFLIEHGAEGFALQPNVEQYLKADLDLTDRLASQLTTVTFGWNGAAFRPLEAGEPARLLDLSVDPVGKRLVTFRGGMGDLIAAIGERLPEASLVRGARIRIIESGPDGLAFGSADGRTWQAEAAVLAVPAGEAARLLENVDAKVAGLLAAVPAISSVTVSLAVPQGSAPDKPAGAGFVVEGGSRDAEGLKACGFSSSKFPGRAPDGWELLRAFYRPGPTLSLDEPDGTWVDRAVADLSPILGLDCPPADAWVTRWREAIPRPGTAAMNAIVSAARRLGSRVPIALAGAATRGAGIGPAIESGRAAVRSLLVTLPSASPDDRAS